ncbi:MYND finger family protein [Metarhizium rileyi]|uniref:MYND finger family protein n=1 Tax=Metarhizium rileyi (strain RCEF 4871) TaxID=1649241 RepID=A0A167ITK1_METRR|nr:MYND finger family protein [Metarhizium rileyi RCEF 4871]
MTDYTMPLRARKEALDQYSFVCTCVRCSGDMNVYQVPAPHAAANSAVDVSGVSHAAVTVTDKTVQDMAAKYTAEPAHLPDSLPARYAALKAQYHASRNLIDANLWAVSPVPQLLTETSIYFAEQGNFPYALALVALVATSCDPYRYAAPFHPVRVKNIFMMAKLLANTAENTGNTLAAATARGGLGQRLQEVLSDMDQVSLCQMLLILIVKMCPGELADWELCLSARDMLADIEMLSGREKELSLIDGWAANGEAETSKVFFEYAVVKQVNILAGMGREAVRIVLMSRSEVLNR